MSGRIKSVEKEIRSVEEWVGVIMQNEKVPSREFIEQTLEMRRKALEVYENLAPHSSETAEVIDPFMNSVEKLIKANEPEIQKKITELIKDGKTEPEDFFELLSGLLKEHSTLVSGLMGDEELPSRDATPDSCLACVVCIACYYSAMAALGATGAFAL